MAQQEPHVHADPGAPSPYLPALDGLRAISILLVVLSHLGLDHVLPGAFGVTLFFFISGYLITRQLLRTLLATGRTGLCGFYLRRALRLMPTALSYIAISGLLYQAAGGQIDPADWLAALAYGANYYALWAGFTSTLPDIRQPFNILWSLAIEEHFYLLWPLILGAAWRSARLPWCLLGFCAATLVWRAFLFDQCFSHHPGLICAPLRPDPRWRYNQLYLSTDARADSIAWGVLLAVGEAHGAAWARARGLRPLIAALVLAASFALPGAFAHYVVRTSLQGAALVFLVPSLLSRESVVVHRVLSSGPALAVGRLSYAIYLWHWGALGLADWAAPRHGVMWLTLAAGLTCLLSGLAYVGIEQPMLRLRRRAGSHVPLELTG